VDLSFFTLDFILKYGKSILISLFIVFLGTLALKKANKVLAIFWQKSNIDSNVANLCNHLIRFIIYLLITLSVLNLFKIDIWKNIFAVLTPLWASIVAIMVVLKDNVSNLVSGLFIILSKSIHIGDYIEVNSAKGKVVQIGYLFTTLLTEDKKTVLIPNVKLTTEPIFRRGALDVHPINLILKVKSKSKNIEIHQKKLQNMKNMLERYIFLYIGDIIESPPPKMTFLSIDEGESIARFVVWSNKNKSKEVIKSIDYFIQNKVKDFAVEIIIENQFDST